jgi:hypothetical protein
VLQNFSVLLIQNHQFFLKNFEDQILIFEGTKEDFWRMVWEQDSRIIVALCQTVERGRIKCDHYWPYDNEPEWVGSEINLQMVKIYK